MSVLSFCACMADHYSVLALPNMNSPDPQINVYFAVHSWKHDARYIQQQILYIGLILERWKVKGEMKWTALKF